MQHILNKFIEFIKKAGKGLKCAVIEKAHKKGGLIKSSPFTSCNLNIF